MQSSLTPRYLIIGIILAWAIYALLPTWQYQQLSEQEKESLRTSGELEQIALSEVGLSPSSFDLPGLFNSFGSMRPILTTTQLELQENPLTFSFDLPRGSYATVFLREYLKSPLSQM